MPWPVHPVGFFGSGDQDTYKVERSLRFNSADSAYLNRTPASAGNRKTWTWSGWVKRSALGSNNYVLFSRYIDANNFAQLRFTSTSSDELRWYEVVAGIVVSQRDTSQVFRDASAYYHIIIAYDTTQAVASDRIKIYLNGFQITAFATAVNPTQSYDGLINAATEHQIGALNAGFLFNGYLAEIHFIDGQALTPSSFGETDPITGRWKAKRYAGTYGTNGFYLNFADNSGTTSTTLGKDLSGNGNNWTPNNFSVTAGAGNDSLLDSPTDSGASGNYCTWNPLVPGDSAANGNLDVTNDTARGNQELMKYNSYWEVTSTGGTCLAGIISTAATSTVTVGSAKTFGFKLSTGGVFEYANVTDGSSFTSQATATTPPLAYASAGSGITASLNAGQRTFVGTLPTGFKAPCTTNLPAPTIRKPSRYMDVKTYTGTGASNSITGLDFSPDLVWIKNRGTTTNHALYDTTRGTQAELSTNGSAAEVTSSTGLTAFGSNGFTIGTSSLVNTSGTQYVAWAWDEAPIAGMDIVSATSNGSGTLVFNHNLGVSPSFIIYKRRDGVGNWVVWSKPLTSSEYLNLNLTSAKTTYSGLWSITSSSVTVIDQAASASHIAYLFAEVEGFSKFGSYTGNGSADGPFVWCGFRPSVVIAKSTGGTGNWTILDYQREGYNVDNDPLFPNLSNAEGTTDLADFLSNGFKIRTTDASFNTSGSGYIFSAWSESPFKYARAR